MGSALLVCVRTEASSYKELTSLGFSDAAWRLSNAVVRDTYRTRKSHPSGIEVHNTCRGLSECLSCSMVVYSTDNCFRLLGR